MLTQRHYLKQRPDRKQSAGKSRGFIVSKVMGVLYMITILAAAMISFMTKGIRPTEHQNEELNLLFKT